MLVQLEFDPKEASYQFLHEIALYETNPDNLDEIYDVVTSCELRKRDCSDWDCPTERRCSEICVKEAIATNQNVSMITSKKLVLEQDEILQAIIAARTNYDEVIDVLINSVYVYVLKNLLENPNLKKKHFNRIFKNFLNGKYDFNCGYNQRRRISEFEFVNRLRRHKFASVSQVEKLAKSVG